MNISEISIRRPVFAWMLMAALILFGGIGFQRMGVSQLPDVDFPVVNVGITYEGAAPEVVELNVVEPLEQAVMAVQGIKTVTSTSRNGRANVTLEFVLDKDIDTAVQEVQTVIAQLQRVLPKNIDPMVVSKQNPEDQPIMWLAVMSDKMSQKELMSYVREKVQDKFTTVDGVGEIFLGGFVDPNLRVNVNGNKLKNYALTVTDVISAIQSEHAEIPSGKIEMKDREIDLRTVGEAKDPEEFMRIAINRRGGSPNFVPIRLGEVATVEEGLADVRRLSRSGGKTAVGLGIKKQRGTNAVEVAKKVKARMAEVSKYLPEGSSLGIRFDSTQFIEEAVGELNHTLILSAILTSLVCWAFLGSFSSTLNVILAIPTSIVGTFTILYWMGFTLNTFTLLGLSLAIGIVVDDAIMVLENIVRHREMGKTRFRAAIDGSREITFAAIAATGAILAIFLPVAFMSGVIGKYFFQFGVTLSVAVALSLVEALTLAPMRCAQFLDINARNNWIGRIVEGSFKWSERTYHRSLTFALNHRVPVLLGALVIFGVSMIPLTSIKKEFVPAQDQGNLMVRLQAPIGSSLAFTDEKFKQVEQILSQNPNVAGYYVSIGGFGGGDVDTGMSFVTLKPRKERPKDPKLGRALSQQELADVLRNEFKQVKDCKIFIQDLSLAGFSAKRGFPIEFTIRGPDWDELISSSKKMMEAMGKTGLMVDIDSDYRAGMPEIQIIPNRLAAKERGISITDINATVNAMMGGVVVAKYTKGSYRYDVRVRLNPDERATPESLNKLLVRNNRGELIPIQDVVTFKEIKSLQAIAHQDRERAISVFANMAKGVPQETALQSIEKIAKESLPNDYRAVVGGSAQTFKESFQQLLFAMLLGLVVAYMILASQFNSFIHPFTVLLALPFSLSGAFVTLWLAGQSLNVYSFIGLILLMGIAKKNSILLVDFTNQTRRLGKPVREALLEACPMRLRPILMTSIATVVGAIPAALSIGPGAESRIPMALCVIGGITLSTLLTLYVVPCFYSVVARKNDPAVRTPEEMAALSEAEDKGHGGHHLAS